MTYEELKRELLQDPETRAEYDALNPLPAEIPNAETLEAFREVERMKADPARGKTYTDVDEMIAELLQAPPEQSPAEVPNAELLESLNADD